MGKIVTSAPEINPFNHKLATDERFRLKDGILTIEKSDVRVNSNAWTRFWNRGEYSQSAILKHMGKLYKAAKNDQLEDKTCHINNTFLENYKTLIGRAVQQNNDCEKMNSISRFFNAKSFIKTDKAVNKFNEIEQDLKKEEKARVEAEEQKAKEKEEARVAAEAQAKIDNKLENSGIGQLIKFKSTTSLSENRINEMQSLFEAESTPWWDDQGLAGTDNIYDGFDYPISTVETVLEPLGKKVKPGNTTDQLTAVLKALGLYEVQGHMDNNINGPLHLELYLLKNKEALVQKLRDLDFVQEK